MSLQNKYHIQVHFWLPKIENNFTMPKPSSVSKLSFLWKVCKKMLGHFTNYYRTGLPFRSLQRCAKHFTNYYRAGQSVSSLLVCVLAHDILDHWHRCQQRRSEGDSLYENNNTTQKQNTKYKNVCVVCTCTRHIGSLTQMPEEEERERGKHSVCISK